MTSFIGTLLLRTCSEDAELYYILEAYVFRVPRPSEIDFSISLAKIEILKLAIGHGTHPVVWLQVSSS